MMQNGYKICNKEFATSAWQVFLLILVLPSAIQLKAEQQICLGSITFLKMTKLQKLN